MDASRKRGDPETRRPIRPRSERDADAEPGDEPLRGALDDLRAFGDRDGDDCEKDRGHKSDGHGL
jgi:hypothetical protein